MTKEDVIRMAREAGVPVALLLELWPEDALCDSEIQELQALERFAALIEAAVREDEREACALKAEEFLTEPESDWDGDFWNQAVERVAFAIRARKESTK